MANEDVHVRRFVALVESHGILLPGEDKDFYLCKCRLQLQPCKVRVSTSLPPDRLIAATGRACPGSTMRIHPARSRFLAGPDDPIFFVADELHQPDGLAVLVGLFLDRLDQSRIGQHLTAKAHEIDGAQREPSLLEPGYPGFPVRFSHPGPQHCTVPSRFAVPFIRVSIGRPPSGAHPPPSRCSRQRPGEPVNFSSRSTIFYLGTQETVWRARASSEAIETVLTEPHAAAGRSARYPEHRDARSGPATATCPGARSRPSSRRCSRTGPAHCMFTRSALQKGGTRLTEHELQRDQGRTG